MSKSFRLYISECLEPQKNLPLTDEQAHYLKNVVKYTSNDKLYCFDNQNGEFLCDVVEQTKKQTLIQVKEQTKPFYACPDIWLLFCPLKKDKTDFVIEKATELGCRTILPVISQYTNCTSIKIERYMAQSIEAAEQCRRTDLPLIEQPQKLTDMLKSWDTSRTLYFMDETLTSAPFIDLLQQEKTNKAAILVGPEGGFSETELTLLRNLPFAKGATLGPRILRAETAVAAALSSWQLIAGDWRTK